MTGPLAGVKMIDLSQVIAGPYGPALLADAGAEVVKVETHQGEIARSLGGSFLSLNRGKRSLPLNLQTEAGKEVMYRLAKWADVMVENFRPGVVQRLKVDYETLSALNPRLIYVSVTAFGASGPYAHRPGFDPLLQAMTGTERAQGGRHNPPVFLRIAITDYVTAMVQAGAVTMALYNRERTGHGCHINTSLLRNGIFINAEAFTRYEGRPERVLPDAGQHGLGPLDRMYATRDGWLFLLVEEDEERWRKLVVQPRFASLDADVRFSSAKLRGQNADALAQALADIFATDRTESWLVMLESHGVPCAPVVEHYDRTFFEDVQPMVNGYSVAGDHANRGRVEHTGNFIHYGASPTTREAVAAPLLGQHTDAVLAELGYDAEAIARLRAESVVV
ncbi:MAG TPA: CoA transferase [Dehalococcoidia bacterium]|nr:CoA transferase [Dehalococcoidia bacterium]